GYTPCTVPVVPALFTKEVSVSMYGGRTLRVSTRFVLWARTHRCVRAHRTESSVVCRLLGAPSGRRGGGKDLAQAAGGDAQLRRDLLLRHARTFRLDLSGQRPRLSDGSPPPGGADALAFGGALTIDGALPHGG